MAKILICDDSGFTRNRVKSLIGEKGYTIIEATDGEDALHKVKQEQPDLILLDLLMPKIDGLEVLETLRKLEIKTPVIVLSADIQSTTKAKCMELGAFEFLNKPPKAEELQQTINKALSQ